MRLRGLDVPAGAVLAPMAGLTDSACRHMMAKHAAAWTVSEMVSAKALTYGDKKSLGIARDTLNGGANGLYAVQLFASDPQTLDDGIQVLKENHVLFDILDINMGCPAPKITSGGAGSKLLLDPPHCGRITASARKALGDDVPLTIKMRIGWDDAHKTGVAVAEQCAENGADLITVHGRTQQQMFAPPVDYAAIAEIKRAVKIPVLANGDISSPEQALRIIAQTGCDGVMIGRAALGNPWLFDRVRAALCGEEIPQMPTLSQKMSAMRVQIYQMCEDKGEHAAMLQARSHAMYYIKGLRGAAALRRQCAALTYFADVDDLIDKVLQYQSSE